MPAGFFADMKRLSSSEEQFLTRWAQYLQPCSTRLRESEASYAHMMPSLGAHNSRKPITYNCI
jgi:hypothetical protein